MLMYRFLNSVLHLAHAAEANKAWDKKEGLHKGLDTMSQADTLPVLSSSAATPDLVFFGVASFGRKWQGTQVSLQSGSHTFQAFSPPEYMPYCMQCMATCCNLPFVNLQS